MLRNRGDVMKRVLIFLLIFALLLPTFVNANVEPYKDDGSPSAYEDSEAGGYFQGTSDVDDSYFSKSTEIFDDYYKSLLNQGHYGDKNGPIMDDKHIPDCKLSYSITSNSTELKHSKSGTTANDKILDLGTIYLGDKIRITDCSIDGQGATGNSVTKVDVSMIARRAGFSYNTSAGIKELSKGGSFEFNALNTGTYLVAAQASSGPKLSYFKNESGEMVEGKIYSVNGAHHAWGERIYKGKLWNGFSHYTGFTFRVGSRRPVADFSFSDTTAMSKTITLGESFTIVDKSKAVQNGASIKSWFVKAGSNKDVHITTPSNFFCQYTPSAAGTYEYTLHSVTDTLGETSEKVDKTLTVTVVAPPVVGKGKVIYEFYKESVEAINMLNTVTTAISDPYIVSILPTIIDVSTGKELVFKSADYSGDAVLGLSDTCKSGDILKIKDTTKDLKIKVIYIESKTPTPDAPVPPIGLPPEAILKAPERVTAGQVFTLDGSLSTDKDGTIEDYQFFTDGGVVESEQDKKMLIYYPAFLSNTSRETDLTVVDNDGLTATDTKTISVLPPIPTIVLKTPGIYKENRKITLDLTESRSPSKYPINNYKFEFSAIGDGADTNSIKKKTTDSFIGTNIENAKVDIIIKKAGIYRLTATIINTAGYQKTEIRDIAIVADLLPDAMITFPKFTLRDTHDNNLVKNQVTNLSSSPDGDIINKSVLYFCFDVKLPAHSLL